ncbi:hypothetical protein KPH14_010260 [Odynerus spinipes]|uniref:Mediator of RNA polymerase II transcription subunit 6 n=1 Tax=Odynerus spinipes TaxID=1348599 RepID=A0AAD9RUU6_9HYME|nr:hypothetical protein KPH14_010260 [Odynerus spinipes]
MMSGRSAVTENPLGFSWHDSAWIPVLNPSNIMDYFSERSNPFYDRTCNNEIVKMQRLSPDQLTNMTGLEYILLHVQEPILYVIRKQHRHSPTLAAPLADYYIIAGVVYQAPDLASIVSSKLLSTVHHLQSAFEEASSCSRYHPSKGYYWDFKNGKSISTKKETPVREEPSSLFQRQRVDMLLGELTRKFPLPVPKPVHQAPETVTEIKQEVKVEKKDMKPPPEKKPRKFIWQQQKMCDDNVCDGCLETESQDDDYTSIDFIKILKHEKCKVIQLVREQIHKFEDTQILPIASSTRKDINQFEMEGKSFVEESNRAEKMPVSLLHTVSQQPIIPSQTWVDYIYSRLCSKFILVIFLIGTLFLLMLCGGLLKVFLCGNGRVYLTPLKYFYAKRIVF